MTKDEALKLAQDYLTDHQIGVHIITAIKQALAAQPATEKSSATQPVQEPSPFGILFAVEQAIENGDCPMEIEIQFDAYEAERRGKNNG
jgi:hypothetical protein